MIHMANKKMKEVIRDTENFLNNHKPGETFHVFLSTSEKEHLQNSVKNLLVEKKFRIVPGVFKPGCLEHDYYLEAKK